MSVILASTGRFMRKSFRKEIGLMSPANRCEKRSPAKKD